MDGSIGSSNINKSWDHAWSTEEMRKNRRDWSLAGDSGLLKHLQEFSENLTKKANETQDIIDSMTSQLNETAIFVDNVMNTSLALANTQFIESRVQEDNIEVEQPIENIEKQNENDHEFNATDLLVSVCESIRQGLNIMDEKYEKVEVVASDSEDDDDNAVPSVILRAKDPYQNRPLPFVIGTEQWKVSNKVGLESSSSESELNDENEDSISDIDDKNVGNTLSSNACSNLGISRLSSTSSESNDYNIESSSIKDTDNRLHAKSQDTLNSGTEPTTPSSILAKKHNIKNGPPSFAEELAKRLGNVLPSQKNAVIPETNEQVINHLQDDIFTSKDDEDVFCNKSNNLFTEGKNLFFDEISFSSTKNRPIRPVNTNIIPPSIDVPPPLSMISSAPKSTIDDLFGDADDSEDSDDIFSKKIPKDIFSGERETIRSEVVSNQKNLDVENIQNASTITTSTPEMNDKSRSLFEEEEEENQDDLFGSDDKEIKSSNISSISPAKKKPIGGVSILGKVDILSSSKFVRRSSSPSSSESDSVENRINTNTGGTITSKNESSSDGINVSSLEAGNNAGNSRNTFSENNTGSSSGISIRQPSIDNTAGSSLGADFQPLMTSSRLKSEEIYREHVDSDSLFSNKSKSNATSDQLHRQQSQVEDVTGHVDVFGPPPLFKVADSSRPKSKVASLFDDSDSGDDLFISASPDTKSLKSVDRTPAKRQNEGKKSLFDNDDDLFGSKDVPDVDLFAAAPVHSLSKVADRLFSDNEKPVTDSGSFDQDPKEFTKSKSGSTVNSLFGEISNIEKVPKYSVNSLFGESSENVNDSKASGDNLFEEDSKGIRNLDPKNEILNQSEDNLFKDSTKVEKVPDKKSSNILFEDSEDFLDSDLFSKASKPKATVSERSSGFLSNSKNIFEDDLDSDLFGCSSNSILKRNIIEDPSENLFDGLNESSDLFGFGNKGTNAFEQKAIEESAKTTLEDKPNTSKSKKLSRSIFDDSDDDDQDLFSGFKFSKKADSKKESDFIFEDNKYVIVDRTMEEKNTKKEENLDSKKKGEKSDKRNSKKLEDATSKLRTKTSEKTRIFDDNEDDDDELFGSRKETSATEKETKDKEMQSKSKVHTAVNASSKKDILTEIKRKLEKHNVDQSDENVKSESSDVDGAVSSKKEPPKTLKIVATPSAESSANQQSLKKPAMSGKIKNLMGKMNDLKILSPTDTPPLWRKKNDEKNSNDNEQEIAADFGSSEASTPSFPSSESSPRASGTNSGAKDSPSSKSDNTEVAISFDEPAQVETLTSITSKSRVRIQTKRRPQSRHARQSALRYSGIDFDAVDVSGNDASTDQSITDFDARSTTDGLASSKPYHNLESSRNKSADSDHVDDKSDLSISRNTTTNLLSPSTDEEDLFDVPPDLPEDLSTKDDSLFGRAPILSPVANLETDETKVKSTESQKIENKNVENPKGKKETGDQNKVERIESMDPLRDDSHDPLKDPSQLFAFVTKTPSPDKSKGLFLSKDDDSLFSNSSKSLEKAIDTKSKPVLDLFDDDTNGSDLFSSSKRKMKKTPKDSSINLLDDACMDNDDNGLFGSVMKKNNTTKSENNSPSSSDASKVNMDTKNTKTVAKDIFENSSDDDDIFASSKKPMKKKTQSLFEDDEDNSDNDIFRKPESSSTRDKKVKADNERVVTKKSVTKDLKKTAKKIVEDPLSVLQDD